MPRPYPPEFRRRAIALVKSGRTVEKTAIDLDISQATIYAWINQDRIDRGEITGRTTKESKELRKAANIDSYDGWHAWRCIRLGGTKLHELRGSFDE